MILFLSTVAMVLIPGGKPEIRAHVWGQIGNLYVLFKASIKIDSSRKSEIYFQKRLFSFTRARHALSYHDRSRIKTITWMSHLVQWLNLVVIHSLTPSLSDLYRPLYNDNGYRAFFV